MPLISNVCSAETLFRTISHVGYGHEIFIWNSRNAKRVAHLLQFLCSAGIGSSRRRNCGLWWCSFHLLWLWIKQCVLPPPALTPPLPPSSLHPPPSSCLEKALMQHPSGFHSSSAYTRFLTFMFVESDFTFFFIMYVCTFIYIYTYTHRHTHTYTCV